MSGPICILFGSRPEVIKLAPVARALASLEPARPIVHVASGQHADMLPAFARELGLPIDRDLAVGRPGQTPLDVCQRVMAGMGALLAEVRPAALIVQGDTSTTLGGALAGFHERVPIGHVEAGLRSGDLEHPFPEEMNRRLITQLARWHFAATPHARDLLLAEGVADERVIVTGNPVVDSLDWARRAPTRSPRIDALLEAVGPRRLLLVTTHRRESFGEPMRQRLRVLRRFVEAQPDIALVLPVHPNPAVRAAVAEELGESERIHPCDPLEYGEFVALLEHCWLIVSDSGGVQEEAPRLGKPVLVIRETTDRPESVDAGLARLVGDSAEALERALHESLQDAGWSERIRSVPNPYGEGDAGERIARALDAWLSEESGEPS